ncbi:inositol monophosphatase family protein [Sphingomonas sp. ac-8]|uniref:inositol monophosphatase family protein n=1 Tax=Sphingomonas sp. ac-8 TaxID=3242977 RepID=UPI003A811D72
MTDAPDPGLLADIEQVALELATLGGAECRATLGGMLTLSYKGGDPQVLTDPVSEVDQRVEAMIRARLDERFPDHDIIGEEVAEHTGRDSDWIWAVDPVDGTTNFVNGFPLFASSVGVLYRGRPVAGAVWCSTGHRLVPGVYHARQGGGLSFDGEPVTAAPNPAVRRRLAGVPETGPKGSLPWESRKTGSAAIECAFTAIGLLQVARFGSPNLWDVAGGMALVEASGRCAYERRDDGWHRFDGFATDSGDLRDWRRRIILGEPQAAAAMVEGAI